MFWILLIVTLIIVVLIIKKKESSKQKKFLSPPTEDVYILGCCGSVECGYWSPEVIKRADGGVDINSKKCYCAYNKQWVKEFSPCPFAKEHPELLINSSSWSN
ncbi:MAG: hypothetical protein IJZ34_10215 [Lachnospiraceae bacterium]|nr:hypothetical protein [Lachnospiraceae bacterium]